MVVDLTNQQRLQNGCNALTINTKLNAAADRHSRDMALNDVFSHTGSDGSKFTQRIQDAGYSYSTAAENIAVGYRTPQDVVTGWMNSEGHRRNILNCALQEIGVSYYYHRNDGGNINYHHYWTQVFGTP